VFEHGLEQPLAQDIVAVHDRVRDVRPVATERFSLSKKNKSQVRMSSGVNVMVWEILLKTLAILTQFTALYVFLKS
jgi:hypothetical protein